MNFTNMEGLMMWVDKGDEITAGKIGTSACENIVVFFWRQSALEFEVCTTVLSRLMSAVME